MSDCPQKIVNTAPYIPDWDQYSSIVLLDNAPVTIYTVPTVLDAEGDSWTVGVDIQEISGFATFEPSIESIVFDISSTNTPAGIYRAQLTVDDGAKQNVYELEITVVEVNTAPYFVNWATQSEVKLTQNELPTDYFLPEIKDDEGDNV